MDIKNYLKEIFKSETKVNWKTRAWKYATVLIVTLVILNPEMAGLALFIDAVGLDLFIMLLQIQVLAIVGTFFNTKIKPTLTLLVNFYIRHCPNVAWAQIKKEPKNIMLLAPGPASLMYILVFLAITSIVFNTP